jgi:sn-glycerol 3-phosphate transport system substrate-binding protein
MRSVIYDDLEAIFSGNKSAQQGLDDAVKAGNSLLRKFEKMHQ